MSPTEAEVVKFTPRMSANTGDLKFSTQSAATVCGSGPTAFGARDVGRRRKEPMYGAVSEPQPPFIDQHGDDTSRGDTNRRLRSGVTDFMSGLRRMPPILEMPEVVWTRDSYTFSTSAIQVRARRGAARRRTHRASFEYATSIQKRAHSMCIAKKYANKLGLNRVRLIWTDTDVHAEIRHESMMVRCMSGEHTTISSMGMLRTRSAEGLRRQLSRARTQQQDRLNNCGRSQPFHCEKID